jgi:hypothetical protein
MFSHEGVHYIKPNVVARMSILVSNISQSGYQELHVAKLIKVAKKTRIN